MIGTIIIECADGRVETREAYEYADVEKAKSKYVYITSVWDYAARVGNPINIYFRERSGAKNEEVEE